MSGHLLHALGWAFAALAVYSFASGCVAGSRKAWRGQWGWFADFFGAWLGATLFGALAFACLMS
jgi:hypothetical protein